MKTFIRRFIIGDPVGQYLLMVSVVIGIAISIGGCVDGSASRELAEEKTPEFDVLPESIEKATYYWTDLGIKTSDGRFFPLNRKNIRDKDGNPLIIMEALVSGGSGTDKMPQRDKMGEAELTNDIWMRLQDQDLDTLELIPSRFDNEGDLRKMFVTITDEEAEHLQLQGIERYRIKADGYDKIAVPLWIILKRQQEIQKTRVDDAHIDKVKTLRKSEIPSA
jgi:hypothetical protein